MRMTNNTILITGGGSGIGRGLAEAFHKLDNQVVIAGRDQKKLDEVTTANPGMRSLTVDMANTDSVLSFAAKITSEFPSLDVVILNARIKRPENILNQKEPLSDVDVTTNLTGPIHLVADLLPTLRKQSHTGDHDGFVRLGVRTCSDMAYLLRDQKRQSTHTLSRCVIN